MKYLSILIGICAIVGLTACSKNRNIVSTKILDSDFEATTEAWAGGIAGYSSRVNADSIRFSVTRTFLPSGLDTVKYALRVEGRNFGTNMFMFLKKKINGLNPGQNYTVSFDVDMGTNYPMGASGAVVASNSVFIKAGASLIEPTALSDTLHTFNLDKGKPSESGKALTLLGNTSNEISRTIYKMVNRRNDAAIQVTPDASGSIWICIGIDSGFKGRTILYFDRIRATIQEN